MTSRATQVPALPTPTQQNLVEMARALKQMLDVREGRVGDAMDANVTFRDLVDAGVAVLRPGVRNFNGGSMPIMPPWSDGDGYDPTQDFIPPPAPSNLTATGLFATVQLQWDQPLNRNHAYAEIWRSNTNVIGSAVLIGTSDSRFYVDNLGTGATSYYWVRFVSEAGIKGAFNGTSGVQASTSEDPTYLMQVLSDAYGSTSQAPFFQIDQATVINGVSIPAGTYIKQAFIADATISRAKIQLLAVDDARIANLNAAKITTGFLDAGRIQAGSIDASKIDTRNLTIKDSDGNIIFSASGVSYLNVSGLGDLATQDTVNVTNITGLGTLATKNSVSSSEVSGLGSFATLDQINTGNVSTYIGSGAITNAYIGNFISSYNFNGSIDGNGNFLSYGTTGWAIGKGGLGVFNNIYARGNIEATSLNAATGTFSGTLSSANGVFTGSLNAVTGTFTGTLSAATISVGTAASAVNFVDPAQPSISIPSTAIGFLAYSGDTGASSYVAQTCIDKNGVPYDCGYYVFAGAPITGPELLFTTNNSSTPSARRIRSGAVRFVVVASGTVDHYFTIWYRYQNPGGSYGSWIAIASAIEPQSSYGSATVSAAGTLGVSLGQGIQFGFSATDTSSNYWNSSAREIRYGTISVTALNF